MKIISILGSTGSVGSQALEIIKNNNHFKVDYLYANSNYKLLHKQILDFNPNYVCINNEESYNELLKLDTKNTKLICGRSNSIEFISSRKNDLVLNAVVGISGLEPTIAILESGTNLLALSNKESLVMAGQIVMEKAKNIKAEILPVDSEHSAIWQCLKGEAYTDIKKIILTASGGPFRTLNIDNFKKITVEDALNHPNWDMGNKITIDSATMMNKGFEVIEAKWLFDIKYSNIEILVHPESIIHSMVEFEDTSIKAQLGYPDMKVPINYALNYPLHSKLNLDSLDLSKIGSLSFYKANTEKFRCIKLAYDALEKGGTYLPILNIANDLAVDLFLKRKISFIEIPHLIESCFEAHDFIENPCLDDIYTQIDWVKEFIMEKIVTR